MLSELRTKTVVSASVERGRRTENFSLLNPFPLSMTLNLKIPPTRTKKEEEKFVRVESNWTEILNLHVKLYKQNHE
jgi:hypothetical protein